MFYVNKQNFTITLNCLYILTSIINLFIREKLAVQVHINLWQLLHIFMVTDAHERQCMVFSFTEDFYIFKSEKELNVGSEPISKVYFIGFSLIVWEVLS